MPRQVTIILALMVSLPAAAAASSAPVDAAVAQGQWSKDSFARAKRNSAEEAKIKAFVKSLLEEDGKAPPKTKPKD